VSDYHGREVYHPYGNERSYNELHLTITADRVREPRP